MLLKGGPANSGTKKPLAPKHKDPWRCVNGHDNRPYAVTCLTLGCREKRP